MRSQKTSTLTDILSHGALAILRERSSQIGQLDTLLGFYLDKRLRELVQVAAYQDGTLVLTCANSTVAGQLRYLSRIYMQQLRQHGEFCELKRINAVINPAPPAKSPAREPLKRLSPETAELLTSLSDALGTGEISEALRRLATHVDAAGEARDDHSS